ncbi:MAG: hypothetical protein RIC16_07845 [Rhodospirillales bacterium]
MPPAELPAYEPGDAFYFQGGADYIASHVAGDEIVWRLGNRFEFVTNRNFVFPWISWESEDATSVSRTSSDSNAMWPLEVGNQARIHRELSFFKDKNDIDRPHKALTYLEERDCEVLDTVSISVKAGRFDTFKIRCERYLNRRSYAGAIIFYYSPLVGHFVKKVSTRSASGAGIMELVSHSIALHGVDDAVRSALARHFQQTLETSPTDRTAEWESNDGHVRSETTITKTFISENGGYCRNYAQRLTVKDRQRTVHGLACRRDNGTWAQSF